MKEKSKMLTTVGITYTLLVIVAASAVLLDTFVIPKSIKENVVVSEERKAVTNTKKQEIVKGTYTETSYIDENISIQIRKDRQYNTNLYIVDIEVSDISWLRTAFAENSYGRNIKEKTSEIAENNHAILAINGDFYGFRNDGYVIRNGELYRESSNDSEDLVIKKDGTFSLIEESAVSANALLEEHAWQVLSFGPGLLKNGELIVDESAEVSKAMTSNPRTAIGMIRPLHYIFLVSDGRTDENEGLTLYQVAQVLKEENCQVAYNLDGGGSTTLWFNGEVLNEPTGGHGSGERSVSDIVYIGYE